MAVIAISLREAATINSWQIKEFAQGVQARDPGTH